MVFWALFFLGTVKTEQPNVIFIMFDDLGWSNVGFHNPAVRTTPFLDKMSKSEHTVELTNVYSTHRTSFLIVVDHKMVAICISRLTSSINTRNPSKDVHLPEQLH